MQIRRRRANRQKRRKKLAHGEESHPPISARRSSPEPLPGYPALRMKLAL
jgi:hypothetical protein